MARPISPAALIRRQVVLEEHDPLPDGSGAVVVRRFVHGETYRSHLLLVPFAGRAAGAAPTPPGRARSPRAPSATRTHASRPTAAGSRSSARSPTSRTARRRSWSRPSTGASRGPCGRRGTASRRSPGRPTAAGWRSWPARRRAASSSGPETKGRVGHRPPDHPDRLALERGRPPRPLGPGLGRAGARRARDPRPRTGHDADAKVDRLGAGRALDRLRRRPATRRRPSAAAVDLGRGTAAAARRARPSASPATPAHPAFSPDGRWLACIGVDVAEPARRRDPGAVRGPVRSRRGRRPGSPPSPLAPGLDRPIGAWNDTDLNGWMASSRPGPFWDGPDAARGARERGRPRPAVALPVRPGAGRSGRRPGAARRRTRSPPGRSGVGGGVVSLVATLDDRPMELLTVDGPGAARPRPRRPPARGPHHPRRRLAARLPVAGDAAHRGARPGRPDRDLDRLTRPAPATSRCRRSSTSTAARSAPGRRRPRSRTSSSRRAATG